MNILPCSDLHTNFHKDGGKSIIKSLRKKDVDVLVVAGDLSIITNNLLQDNIKQLCNEFPEVVYVSGNHSYYHSSFDRVDDILSDLRTRIYNFTWLNDDRVEINGTNFIGATLWFPNSANVQTNKNYLNDFNCIVGFEPEVFVRNKNTIEFLANNIQKGDVVVTHHMPTYKCVNAKFVGSRYNCFFACNLDVMIKQTKPALMICGHTHHPCDFTLFDSRIIANPLGYPGENPYFKDDLIVRV